MCLSNGPITGISYWLGYTIALHIVLWSAPETRPSFELDARAVARVAAVSLLWTVVSVMAGWLLIRFLRDVTDRPRCVSALALLLIACVGSTLFAFGQEVRRQVLAKSGVDVFTRAKTRYVVTGVLIGMLASAPFIFGLI